MSDPVRIIVGEGDSAQIVVPNYSIIAGRDGPPGPQGEQGEDGKSAYEVAVDNGFVGTPEEWLESLKGETGKSAYESAVDGGYTGTEAEFNAELADIEAAAQTASTAADAAVAAQGAAEDAQSAAETAVTHYPKIEDGTWHVWDAATGTYVDTEINATGPQGPVGPGVPAGGADGNVLVKDGAANYAAKWSSTPPQMGSLAMIETSPATAAHEVGDYIVYNGQLYIVTAAISAGQSLTKGTNIRARTAGAGIFNKERYHSTFPSAVSVPNDTITNVASLTIPPGVYLIIYATLFPSNAVGYRQMGIALNESEPNMNRLAIMRIPAANGERTNINSSFCNPFETTTTLYLNVKQTSGGALSVTGGIQALELERY